MGQKIEIKYKGKVLTIVSIAETGLVLSNKGIESILDIEGLDQLVNLEKLWLNDNRIARIEGLDRLVNLKWLFLDGNQIARIEGLHRLVNLKWLFLDGNQIARIEGLDRLVRLERLELHTNQISRIEGLDLLVNLEWLNLGVKIAKIEGLDRLVNLKHLGLSGNRITRIEGLDRLVKLEWLNLMENHIAKIEGLDLLVNLKQLYLDKNQIARIEGLDQLVNLEHLFLDKNQIARIEGLDRLVNLKELYLDGNKILKFEGLERLVKLEELHLGNTIAKIEGFDRLVNLKKLGLGGNQIATAGERDLPGKGKTIIVQLTDSHSDSETCSNMNLKAKEALKSKDFTTAANILNELTTLCARNLQAIHVVKDKYSEMYFIKPDATYQNWNVTLQSNLKIIAEAEAVNQEPAGLSDQKLVRTMKKWKDAAAATVTHNELLIPHEKIPSTTKRRARIFALAGGIGGFFIGWANTSPLEGCMFATIAGISMYLLVIAMTSIPGFLPTNTILAWGIATAFGGMGWLVDTLGGGDGPAGLALGLKIGLLLGITQSLTCWEMDISNHLAMVMFMALGGGAGAGIGALIGLFSPTGAGYGAGIGLFIGAPVAIVLFVILEYWWFPFFYAGGIIVSFIIGPLSPLGVGIGAAWGLYIALLVAVVIILGLTCVRYQQEKFPEISTW